MKTLTESQRMALLEIVADRVRERGERVGVEEFVDVAGNTTTTTPELLTALMQPDPPTRFHNSKWSGQGGFGDLGQPDQRVVLQRERKGLDRSYVVLVDDRDPTAAVAFRLNQVERVIAALQRAREAARD